MLGPRFAMDLGSFSHSIGTRYPVTARSPEIDGGTS